MYMHKEFTLFTLASKNVKRKPFRTIILISAIGLLVSVLVFALSFARRIDSGIKTMSARLGADILVVPTGSRGSAEDILLENKVKSFYMDKSLLEKVKKVKGISKITYQTYLVTMQGLCCDVPESVVVAFDQDTDFVIAPWMQKSLGRKLKPGEAIVGSESSYNITVGLVEVDSVLFGNVFRMVGVLDKTGTGLDNAIFMDAANIDDIIKKGKSGIRPDQISIILIKVTDGADVAKVAADIEDSVIEVDAVARKDIGKNLISALRDINNIFFITVIIASILSIFLAWAVFSSVVSERSMEVGIMRAIGARESHVMSVFMFEVVLIGLAGSLLGIGGGTGLSIVLAKGFSIMKSISVELSLAERAVIAVAGIAGGTGICVLGALLPMLRMKKMEPLMVIKGE